jgi:hypothetical protein
MAKLTLRNHHVRQAITTLAREHHELMSQAAVERRSGDNEAADVYLSRADALEAIRTQLAAARNARSAVLDLDPDMLPHIRDVALFGCDGHPLSH